MSKLGDKLRRVSGASAPPLGFRPASLAPVSPLLLMVQIPQPATENLTLAAQNGADAILIGDEKGPGETERLSPLAQASSPIPWGAYWVGGKAEGWSPLVEAGADFVVVEAATAAMALLQEERLGRVLVVDSSWSDSQVRATEALSLDAVLLRAGAKEFLALGHLLACRRVSQLQRKPLLFEVSPGVSAAELRGLVGVGVTGIVVKLPGKEFAAGLRELRQALDTLPQLKRETPPVVLPQIGTQPGPPSEEEESFLL